MNIWTQYSIELANQKNYLDLLYKIYPMPLNLRREISDIVKTQISHSFQQRNNKELLEILLDQDIFPIKDSYVAYLKKDRNSIDRNPETIQRLAGMLYDMGLSEIFEKTTAPKETNRQIGPLFRNWLQKRTLAPVIKDYDSFLKCNYNAILDGSDGFLANFANSYLGYTRINKGLDLIAKFNGEFFIGEAKFLTDFGGHQNAQFEDAISTLQAPLEKTKYKVKTIAILDGVLYIKSNSKLHTRLHNFNDNTVILSAVLLRDYLYSI